MPTINQSSNKISRHFGPLERKLKQKLLAFYNKRIRGSNTPIEVIRQKYNREIEQLIRNNIQSSWLFAHEIIEDRTGQPVNLTTEDIEGIEKTTIKVTDQFWTTAGKNLQRESEFVIENNKMSKLPEFETGAAMLGISILMLYLAFNSGMLNTGLKLRFTTRENCIDKIICLPLNGRIYEFGAALTPTPPLHKHCRCRLIPISV